MLSVFALTYGAVFAAELAGDKLLYTTGVLATRYRAGPIVIGATFALGLKLWVAVMVGSAVSRLPRGVVAAITTMGFVWVAYALLRKPLHQRQEAPGPREPARGALLSFVLIFSSEWADIGQITTATVAARFGSPVGVWLGAVCAMATKAILAAWLGAGLRKWLRERLSPQMVRYGGVTLLLFLGSLSVAESLLGSR